MAGVCGDDRSVCMNVLGNIIFSPSVKVKFVVAARNEGYALRLCLSSSLLFLVQELPQRRHTVPGEHPVCCLLLSICSLKSRRGLATFSGLAW